MIGKDEPNRLYDPPFHIQVKASEEYLPINLI